MSSVRDWTTGFAVIGTILLGPIIAFLTVTAADDRGKSGEYRRIRGRTYCGATIGASIWRTPIDYSSMIG
jgi:hypothetical protein